MLLLTALRLSPCLRGLLPVVSSNRPMSSRMFSSFFVTPKELSEALSSQKSSNCRIVPVSAEWYIPTPGAYNGVEEYNTLRVPGARFFDLDAIKDFDSPYPHMLPSGETFSKAMSELGIARGDTVVVYDSPHIGIFSGPRAAWTFKVFGHSKVHLLNNFKLWKEQGFPTESGKVSAGTWETTIYPVVEPDTSIVVDFEGVIQVAKGAPKGNIQILDARPNGRFTGVDPEPRPGLSSGHVPGSMSVPFSDLVDPVAKALKTGEELREIFLKKGIDPSSKTEKILMCGTGVTAVVIDTALERAKFEGKRRVYDGSWTEWAQRARDELIVKDEQ